MTKPAEDVMAYWLWPLTAAKLTGDLLETIADAHAVVAARTRMVIGALDNPLAADRRELGLMISEKVDAFSTSAKAVSRAADTLRRVADSDARAVGKVAGGHLLTPAAWVELEETNMAAGAAMLAAPAAAFAPVHRKVAASGKRLRRAR